MQVISRKKLVQFWTERGEAERALAAWYRVVRPLRWASFAAIRQTFPSADLVGNCIVFNVGGNHYRIICRMSYPRRPEDMGKLYILRVMDHKEYDRVDWKTICRCYQPPPGP